MASHLIYAIIEPYFSSKLDELDACHISILNVEIELWPGSPAGPLLFCRKTKQKMDGSSSGKVGRCNNFDWESPSIARGLA